MDSFINGPGKRSVAAMKEELGKIHGGEVISVLFKTARYGNFLATGTAHLTSMEELMVGGIPVAAAAKEAKGADGEPVRQRQPDKDVRQFPAEFTGEFSPQQVDSSELEHGDLAVASFSQQPYGDFVITGVVTAAADDEQYLQLGPWILRDANGPAPRLRDVQLVAKAGTHKTVVPARRRQAEVPEAV